MQATGDGRATGPRTRQRRARATSVVALLTMVACLAGAGSAQAEATITKIPGFYPQRINAAGAIVGGTATGGIAVWKDGQMTPLESGAIASDIADDGTVSGSAEINDQFRSAFWIRGSGAPVLLPQHPDYATVHHASPQRLSPDGQRFGGKVYEEAPGASSARQAAMRGVVPGPDFEETGTPGNFTSVAHPYREVEDITNSGRAIGPKTTGGGFLWEPTGTVTGIPFLPSAINEAGWVTGSDDARSEWQLRSPAGVVTTIPCAPGEVLDINEAGHVLGWSWDTVAKGPKMVVWRDGACNVLEDVLGDRVAGWSDFHLRAFNDEGQVVGWGDFDGAYAGFLIQLDGAITVTETTDEGDADAADGACDADATESGLQCTLRAAIENANAKDGDDKIEFDIGDGGRETIAVTKALPEVTGETLIDGTSQPGATAGEPPIAVDGTGAGNVSGLRVLGENSVVRGLNVFGFEKSGVVLAGEGGHKLEGSWIGFKPSDSGFAAAGNGSGVDVAAPRVTVGGTTVAQRNVISANGNVAGMKAFLDGLDGADVSQASLHDTFATLGTGVVVSDGDAGTVTIAGNWIGPDPAGGRFGAAAGLTSTFGVIVGPENGISTAITIGGQTGQPGTGAGNVISGNLVGVMAVPDPATAGVVDGLDVRGNLIGSNPDGTATGLGGVMGVTVLDRVTDIDIADNRVQGNVLGVMVKEEGARIQGNLIGTDDDLASMRSAMTSKYPTIGLHNIIGVLLGDTEQALLGGPGALGNKILGNLIGALLVGDESHDNAVLGNTFGLSADPGSVPDFEAKVGELGSVIGLLIAGGRDNDVGDPGAGNVFNSNGFGLLRLAGSGGHVQANRFHGNAFGFGAAQASELLIGGDEGAGNVLTANAIGAMLIGWSPTAKELAAARVEGESAVREEDRELALTAPASRGPLNLVDATTTATVDEQSVALGSPPGGASAARGERPVRRRASTGHRIVGNRFGLRADGSAAPNYVGAWLAGTHTGVDVRENAFANNYGGGLWIGSPVALGSGVPEPTGVALTSNRVFENYAPGNSLPGVPALGVDLLEPKPQEIMQQAWGATANDAGDGDTGANGRQNAPVLAKAERRGGTVTVTGVLASKATGAYRVELFANARCNAFGSGEGETPVGGGPFAVGSDVAFTKAVSVPASATRISAAATGADGTSEFSACVPITDAAPPPPGPNPNPGLPAPGPSPGPAPGPGLTPGGDTTPPSGTAKASGTPKAGDPITVTVTSNEAGTVTAEGSLETSPSSGGGGGKARAAAARRLTVKLARQRTPIRARQTLELKLKPQGKAAIKRLKRAVRRGAKATAVVKITFTDRSGNRSTRTLRIKLRR